MKYAFSQFSYYYYIKMGSLQFSHSLWNFFKIIFYTLDKQFHFSFDKENFLNISLKIYYLIALILGLLIFYFKKLFDLNRLFLILSVYYVLIPPSGAEYTLVLLVLNLLIVLNSQDFTKIRIYYLIAILPFAFTYNFPTSTLSLLKSMILLFILYFLLEPILKKRLQILQFDT